MIFHSAKSVVVRCAHEHFGISVHGTSFRALHEKARTRSRVARCSPLRIHLSFTSRKRAREKISIRIARVLRDLIFALRAR
jgi:hypothetical protein